MWYTFDMKTLFFLSFVIAGFAPIFAGGVDSLFGVKFGVPYDGFVPPPRYPASLRNSPQNPDLVFVKREFVPRICLLGFDTYTYNLAPVSLTLYTVSAERKCANMREAFLLAMNTICYISERIGVDFEPEDEDDLMAGDKVISDSWSAECRNGNDNSQSISVTIVRDEWVVNLRICDYGGLRKQMIECRGLIPRLSPLLRGFDTYREAAELGKVYKVK